MLDSAKRDDSRSIPAKLTSISLGVLEQAILRRCLSPTWARSLQAAKPIVTRLVEAGLLERCAPAGLKARNMVRISDAGRAALERKA